MSYMAMIALTVGAPLAPFIESPKLGEYKVCTFLGAGREGSVVRAALPGHECDDQSHVVAIKCAKSIGNDVRLAGKFQNEFDIMSNLAKHDWCPRVVELFHNAAPPNNVCISMAEVGRSVSWTRDRNGQIWTPNTVLSIGIGIMDIMTVMHFEQNLFLADVHMGNFALGKDDQSKLMMIDYADMRPLEAPGNKRGKAALIKDDIRHAILSLRYLFDGRYRFYSAKRYSGYNKEEVCHAAYVHTAVCEAIDYVYTKQGMFTRDDYDHVRGILEAGLSGVEYKGNIIWEPSLPRPVMMTAYISANPKQVTLPVKTVTPPAPEPSTPQAPAVQVAPIAPKPVSPKLPVVAPDPKPEQAAAPVAPNVQERPPATPVAPEVQKRTPATSVTPKVQKPKSLERPPATPKVSIHETSVVPSIVTPEPQSPLRPATITTAEPITSKKRPSKPSPRKDSPTEEPALVSPVSPEEPPKPLEFAEESTTSTTKSSTTSTMVSIIALIFALAVGI